jgi:glycosyltransferase involved in cell wall biosynthesis
VPAFNDEGHLEDALASIAAQSFDRYEVVVCDDASRDGTAAIAEAWAQRDSRIRPLRNRVNLGMTENWNRALAEARAPFVFKLDADDALEREALARLLVTLDSSPEVLFAACRTVECDSMMAAVRPFHGEEALRSAGIDPAADSTRPGWRWFELSFDDHQLWHSSAQLHRTQDLRSGGGWDATWSCASDTDLILRCLASSRPVAHLGYLGVRYRRRAGSVSAQFERSGWKVAESILVTLRALEAAGADRVLGSARLRRNWWRLWSAVRRLEADQGLWRSMPDSLRARLEPELRARRPPPRTVRCEGWLRDRLWRLRRRLRPADRSST